MFIKNIKITKKLSLAIIFILLSLFVLPGDMFASDRMSIAVTPPLFQVSVEPGQPWASSLKLVNNGKSDIEIYANPVNFQASGESGIARFTPRLDDSEDALNPAGWLSVSRGPYEVPAEGSVDIPFTVLVPEDAPPGGHYAAFLVGTDPVDEDLQGTGVKVSSLVTSMLLMRVEGDVFEEGDIREFRTDAGWFNETDVRLFLKFENTGNVHLRPRGAIKIEDMWGKQRGSIPINMDNSFGNVLPDSARSFNFRWEGEGSILEAGRYTASVTLAYGSDGDRYVSDELTFWVIPMVPLVIAISVITLFILILFFSIRLYVKRVVSVYESSGKGKSTSVRVKSKAFIAPARESVIDMKRTVKDRGNKTYRGVLFDILKRYRYFFLSLFVILVVALSLYIFIISGIYSDRSFNVFQEHPISEEKILP
ncbi:MAG: hypothetical protein ACLFNR_00115 [Candidatus Paceibacterota bacterium]